MSKRKQKHRKHETLPARLRHRVQQSEVPQSAYRRIGKRFLAAISLVVTALTAWALFYDFSPKVSVSSAQALNPSDLFSTPFMLLNEGYLAIHDVEAECALNNVKYKNGSNIEQAITRGSLNGSKDIQPHEQMTFKCPPHGIAFGSDLASADVSIIASFQPSFIPWRFHKEFRFVSEKSSDGYLHWFPQPKNKQS